MSHLTEKERYTISVMLANGSRQTEIATALGRNKSVISREINRNKDQHNGEYRYDLAQRKTVSRHRHKPKKMVLTDAIKSFIGIQLTKKFSPEQIVGVAKYLGKPIVSVERIYQYIWQNKSKGGVLYQHLRSKGKAYRKRGAKKDQRGKIIGRKDIDLRPAIVEERSRFGNFEIDTIVGKDNKGAILTINDRAKGILKMVELLGKNATQLALATIETLKKWKSCLHTITTDNGKEFAQHQMIADALDIEFFFAKPYQSWQRGSNENLNGLIRQYIPKKTDFNTISEEFVKWVENKLNNRPSKRFNFKTPIQILNQKVAFMI